MRRKIVLVGGLVALAAGLLFLASAAFGSSGLFADEAGDCDPACGLDLRSVSHADASGNITYTLTAGAGFDSGDVGEIDINYNYEDATDPDDLCIQVRDEGSGLQAFKGSSCVTGTLDSAINVSKTNGSATISITVPITSLTGFDEDVDDDYEYFVDVVDADDNLDTAPNPGESPPGDADNNGYYLHSLSTTGGGSSSDTQTLASASDTTPCPRQSITVRGTGFASGRPLDVFVDTTRIGGAQSDTAGSYVTTVIIPPNTSAGLHRIRVTGQNPSGGTNTSRVDVVVGPCSLPVTGTGSNAGKIALVILFLGLPSGAAMAVFRRRARV